MGKHMESTPADCAHTALLLLLWWSLLLSVVWVCVQKTTRAWLCVCHASFVWMCMASLPPMHAVLQTCIAGGRSLMWGSGTTVGHAMR